MVKTLEFRNEHETKLEDKVVLTIRVSLYFFDCCVLQGLYFFKNKSSWNAACELVKGKVEIERVS